MRPLCTVAKRGSNTQTAGERLGINCQQGVSGIPAGSGDSGGTVYVWTGTIAPRAAGITSKKRNESGGGIYFSPVGQVLASMGYRWFLTW